MESEFQEECRMFLIYAVYVSYCWSNFAVGQLFNSKVVSLLPEEGYLYSDMG